MIFGHRLGRGFALIAIAGGAVSCSALGPQIVCPESGCYGHATDQGFSIAAVPVSKIPQRYRRTSVSYRSAYPAGTIVVDPNDRFLYFVQNDREAIRYGVSVGKGAFAWSGTASIGKKATWPRWVPPREMIDRSPNLTEYRGGLAAGDLNPLGARAIYLFAKGEDTLFRIHGTAEWWSIGEEASSGCIRLLNQDVIDLYDRTPIGSTVVVLETKPKILRLK